MNKPSHPCGVHLFKLIDARLSKESILKVVCIFEGTGAHKRCQTIYRNISKHSPWADSSTPFIAQLEGFNHEGDLLTEIQKYVGQEFRCTVKKGKGWQMNIVDFLDVHSYINSTTHVADPS